MNFRFIVYRITTGLALFVSGLFSFTLFSSVLVLGVNIGVIIFLLLQVACFIHSVYSLYLQRSLQAPEIPLKEGTPGAIRVFGGLGLVFGLLLIFCGLTALMATPQQLQEALQQYPEENRNTIQLSLLKPIGILCLAMGGLFAANITMSFRFLREWQQRDNQSKEE
ncbi:hypothetical protein ACDQ55_01440 [Chitinophaga sp. 30R24]|uniref:hypothetical protein n=1 Tax=Chitinophaga sp. 30R24 TaxID=3248838 RepID=UPI003B90E7A3